MDPPCEKAAQVFLAVDKLRRLHKAVPGRPVKAFAAQQLLRRVVVLAGESVPQLHLSLRIQAHGLADALEVADIADADLKAGKTGLEQGIDQEGQDLGVSEDRVVVDELRAHLGGLTELALQAGGIAEDAADIGEADRRFLLGKIFGGAPGHGGREVRSEHQQVPLVVQELVELPDRSRADLAGKHIVKFNGGSLDVLIAVEPDPVPDLLHDHVLLRQLPAVGVPHAVRSVKQVIVDWKPCHGLLPLYRNE